MKTQESIRIEIDPEIGVSFLDDFKSSMSPICNVQVEKKEKEEYLYATGQIINDIILYIQQNQWAIIIGGYAVAASYDIAKASLIGLYRKLRHKKSKGSEDIKTISIKHSIGDKTAEFELKTNIDDQHIEHIIDKYLEKSKTDELTKVISDRKYLSSDSDFKSAKFVFNENTGIWEPVDYQKIRDDMDKFQKDMEDKFNS